MNRFLPTSLFLCAFLAFSIVSAQSYREMMPDRSVNMYDVIQAAEQHFETHDKGKGSGYKDYQRWKHHNHLLFWPDGDRSSYDPRPMLSNAVKWIRENEAQRDVQRSASATPWRDMGPDNANNFLATQSPGLGRIDEVWVDPADTNRMYVGARNGGFWRTTDNGQTWATSTDKLSQLGVTTIAVSPASPDTILIDLKADPFMDLAGIYRSFDGGLTWDSTAWNSAVSAGVVINKLLFNPAVPGEAYAVTSAGLYRSYDYFQTWQLVSALQWCNDMEFRPGSADTFYLASSAQLNTLHVTHNRGQTFFGSNVSGASRDDAELAVCDAAPDVVYVCSLFGLYRSNDGAISWGPNTFVLGQYYGFGVSAFDPDVLIFGGIDSYYSTDAGSNWTQISSWTTPNDPNYIHADLREVHSVRNHIYIGTDGYVAKTWNGGQDWQKMSDGIRTKEFYRIGVSPTHNSLVVGGSQDNGTSYTWQGNWYEWLGADGMECATNRINPHLLYGEWQFGHPWRTEDFGLTSIDIVPGGFQFGGWITPFVMDKNHPCTMYIGYAQNTYKTTDNGDNWTTLPGLAQRGGTDLEISTINSNLIYSSINNSLWKSTDGGLTSSGVTNNLPNQAISDIALHPRHNDTLVVTYAPFQGTEQVYMSTNGGQTWTDIAYNLPTIHVYDAVFDDDCLYIGTRSGVFYMQLGTNTWNSFNDNLPYCWVYELEIHKGTDMLRAGTFGRGLWERALVGTENKAKIWTIELSPFATTARPTEHSDVDIVCTITDSMGIQSAWVEWSDNTPTFNNTLQLLPTVADTFVSASKIPRQPADTTVHFIVYAVNMNGDTTESDRIVYKHYPYNCAQNNITAGINAPSGICLGDSATLVGTGGWEYTWNQGLGNGTTHTVAPTATTTYALTVTDEDGCTDSTTLTLIVGAASGLNLGADTAFCANSSFALPLDAGPNGTAYQWSTGATTQTITANAFGWYAVTVTASGCTDVDSIFIGSNAAPNVTLDLSPVDSLCTTDGPVNLSGGLPAGGTYTGTGVSGGSFDPAVAGAGTHAITYTYTDSLGCTADTSAAIFVDVCIGVDGPLQDLMTLYPNPSDQPSFFLEATGLDQAVIIRVSDLQGRLVHEENAHMKARQQVKLQDGLAFGTYLVRVLDAVNGDLLYVAKWQFGE